MAKEALAYWLQMAQKCYPLCQNKDEFLLLIGQRMKEYKEMENE